jgi:fatty acid desaturase
MDTLPSTTLSSDAAQLTELAQNAARHAAQLLSAQIALAKDEIRSDLQDAKARAVSLAIGALLLQVAIMLLALGVVLLLHLTAVGVFLAGLVLAVMALILSLYGFRTFRGHAVAHTKERLSNVAQSVVRAAARSDEERVVGSTNGTQRS